jgi:hypothetical protein
MFFQKGVVGAWCYGAQAKNLVRSYVNKQAGMVTLTL